VENEKRYFAEGDVTFPENVIFSNPDYLRFAVVKINPENI
jgi:hypothetical protein